MSKREYDVSCVHAAECGHIAIYETLPDGKRVHVPCPMCENKELKSKIVELEKKLKVLDDFGAILSHCARNRNN